MMCGVEICRFFEFYFLNEKLNIINFLIFLQGVPMPNFQFQGPVKTPNNALDSCFRLVCFGGVSKVESDFSRCLIVSFHTHWTSMEMIWYYVIMRGILISTYESLSNGEILSSVGKTIETIEFAIRFDVFFRIVSVWKELCCNRIVLSMTMSLFDLIMVIFCCLTAHWSRWWMIQWWWIFLTSV